MKRQIEVINCHNEEETIEEARNVAKQHVDITELYYSEIFGHDDEFIENIK